MQWRKCGFLIPGPTAAPFFPHLRQKYIVEERQDKRTQTPEKTLGRGKFPLSGLLLALYEQYRSTEEKYLRTYFQEL